MVRGLLSPSDELERRIAELESDRGVVVDTANADLRRIERDLHDGAQARLVNLAMGLGLAKEKLLEDPDTAAEMVAEAHGEVKLALQELRIWHAASIPPYSPTGVSTPRCPRSPRAAPSP